MYTICIDCRFFGVGDTGIGRYVQNLLANLPTDPNIRVVTISKTSFHPYSIWSQFEMLWLLAKIRPNLLHVPHDAPPLLWFGPTIITIHDLIKLESTGLVTTTLPPWLYHFKNLGYRLLLSLSLFKARHIITPSRYWKDYLISKFNVSANKISVTYEGVDPLFFSIPSLRIENYLVYTGNLYPHKNIPVLVAAANLLQQKTYLVTKKSIFASRLPASDYIEILNDQSDAQVKLVYSKALAFVTPSLLEGFGLPGLEAMAAGCPVIAARASCLPEIYGDAALYFDPTSVSDLIQKIKQLQSDAHLRQQLITAGLQQAKKYSWAKMSAQTWQIYQDVLR